MKKQPYFSQMTGLVLGGGQSRRMGRDKRYLEWEGEAFVDRVCKIMSSLFGEVLLVNAKDDYDCSHLPVRMVIDKIPQKGSLGGLYTGLIESKNFLNFVVACDMPFLNSESIACFCSDSPSDVVVVKFSNRIQPLHGRYSKDCLPVIEKMIAQNDLKIQHLINDPSLSVHFLDEKLFHDVDPQHLSFMNINTPADFEFARKTFS